MQPVNPLEIIISLVLLSLLVKMPIVTFKCTWLSKLYIKLYLHVCKIASKFASESKAIVPAATVVGMSVDALPLSYDSASVEGAHLSIN